jgi:hypothetical protein
MPPLLREEAGHHPDRVFEPDTIAIRADDVWFVVLTGFLFGAFVASGLVFRTLYREGVTAVNEEMSRRNIRAKSQEGQQVGRKVRKH